MKIRSDGLEFRRFFGASVLTAFMAGILGPFFAVLSLLITEPGDGGVAAALSLLPVFTLVGAIIAVPVGFVALIFLGIPLVLANAGPVVRRPVLAFLSGVAAGTLIGGLAGFILFGPNSFAVLAAISGALFGGLWVIVARRAIIGSHAGAAE